MSKLIEETEKVLEAIKEVSEEKPDDPILQYLIEIYQGILEELKNGKNAKK